MQFFLVGSKILYFRTMRQWFMFLLLLGITTPAVHAQWKGESLYPEFWGSPLPIPLELSGTFAEMRPNHYHTGWDFKTEQRSGIPVFAVASGMVSRVKVAPNGYGNALYVNHPNGLTTVYAHLESFSPEIQRWVDSLQVSNCDFKVDVNPQLFHKTFSFNKGDRLGWSGNSGSSGGPHLHFEVRNTITEHPISPAVLGYRVTDLFKPTVEGIWLMPVTQGKPLHLNYAFSGESYGPDSLVHVPADFGVAVETFDFIQDKQSVCGVRSILMMWDGEVVSELIQDSVDFKNNGQIHAQTWFQEFESSGRSVYRCYALDHAPRHMFSYLRGDGVIHIKDTLVHALTVMVTDDHEQATCVYAFVQNRDGKKYPFSGWLPDENHTVDLTHVKVEVPAGALYERVSMQGVDYPDPYRFTLYPSVPLAIPMKVWWKKAPKESGWGIVRYGPQDTVWMKNVLGEGPIELRMTGSFGFERDTIPPLVTAKLTDKNPYFFWGDVLDNASGVKSVSASCQGQCLVVYLDEKSGSIWIPRSQYDRMDKTKSLQIDITVQDVAGNQQVYSFN